MDGAGAAQRDWNSSVSLLNCSCCHLINVNRTGSACSAPAAAGLPAVSIGMVPSSARRSRPPCYSSLLKLKTSSLVSGLCMNVGMKMKATLLTFNLGMSSEDLQAKQDFKQFSFQ